MEDACHERTAIRGEIQWSPVRRELRKHTYLFSTINSLSLFFPSYINYGHNQIIYFAKKCCFKRKKNSSIHLNFREELVYKIDDFAKKKQLHCGSNYIIIITNSTYVEMND